MLLKSLKTFFCSRYAQKASKKFNFTSICQNDQGGFVTPSDPSDHSLVLSLNDVCSLTNFLSKIIFVVILKPFENFSIFLLKENLKKLYFA